MANIPLAAFVSSLHTLDHEEFTEFVVALWAASGWETERSGHVLTVHNGTKSETLLVLPPVRLAQFRPAPATDASVDRVVAPQRVDSRRDLPWRTPEVPVVDAEALRRRVLYAVPGETGDRLCREFLGVSLRDDRWSEPNSTDTEPSGESGPVSRRTVLGVLGLTVTAGAGLSLRQQLDDGPSSTSSGLDGPPPEPGPVPPTATFEFEYERPVLTIEHATGDAIPASSLFLTGRGFEGAPRVRLSATDQYESDESLTPGDSISLRTSPDGRFRLVWASERQQETLASYEVTGRPPEQALEVSLDGPEMSFVDSFEDGKLRLRHGGGEQVNADRVLLRGRGFAGAPSVWWTATESTADTLSAGDSITLWAERSYAVTLYWIRGDQAGILGQFTGPDRPLRPSLGGPSTFGYGTGNTGYAPAESGPVEPPEELWTFDTGNAVGTAPAVVDGIVYAGNFDGTLYALDGTDGTHLWRFETDRTIGLSSPTVWNGTVYIGDTGGTLYAVDAVTGEEKWRYGALQSFTSTPTLVADSDQEPTIYVTNAGSGQAGLYALDARDGTERWISDEAVLRTAPAVHDGTVYVGGFGGLFAFDSTDGTLEKGRSVQRQTTVDAAPVASEGRVYVGFSDGTVLAMATDDGETRWEQSVYGEIRASPTLAPVSTATGVEPTLIVGNTESDTFRALSASDGTKGWRVTTGNTVAASPTVAGSPQHGIRPQTAYLPSFDGHLYAVDPTDGSIRWTHRTDGQLFASPAVADGAVYLAGGDGRIYALSEPDHPLVDPFSARKRKNRTGTREGD